MIRITLLSLLFAAAASAQFNCSFLQTVCSEGTQCDFMNAIYYYQTTYVCFDANNNPYTVMFDGCSNVCAQSAVRPGKTNRRGPAQASMARKTQSGAASTSNINYTPVSGHR